MPTRIFISVAEDSADVHAAALIRKAAERLPGCRFYGLTGPRMQAAGADTIADLTAHAAMLAGTASVIGRALRAQAAVEQSWREQPPDLVVLLDSPELHLRFAKRAREMGLPVLYYIAPQTWASRAGRNERIARDVDRLACILPFEQEYFRERGILADYVGHPLFESLKLASPNAATVERLGTGEGPLVAVLPGSRRHVVDQMLPIQLDVLRRMRQSTGPLRAAVSCVSQDRAAQIRERLGAADFDAELVVADNASLLSECDLALVASGTATLEVAFYRKPMVVLYDAGTVMSGLYRLIGRRILTTPHLSLVNILAGRRVVPEFMPRVPDRSAVARLAVKLLEDESWRRLMVSQIDEVVMPLESTSASARVCEIIADLLGERRDAPQPTDTEAQASVTGIS